MHKRTRRIGKGFLSILLPLKALECSRVRTMFAHKGGITNTSRTPHTNGAVLLGPRVHFPKRWEIKARPFPQVE